jgi:predicted DNA repair protein MutK
LATGLIALLDDIASIAKVAAATVDDVAGQAAKAGAKSAGLVIDDAAVTPRFVVGFTADREIPIVRRIARGSLRNKLLFLLPAALLLSVFAPWAITPLLMLGGTYLSYEGAEKIYEALFPHQAHEHEEKVGLQPRDPVKLENQKVKSAIATDFILSAEIMAIALSTVADAGLPTRAVVLAIVGVAMTFIVYGGVALIVKADDFGVKLAAGADESGWGQLKHRLGCGLVKAMPGLLRLLAIVGTAAMLWVGGGIIVHGLEEFGLDAVGHAIHRLAELAAHAAPLAQGAVEWIVSATGYGLFGLAVGLLTIPLVSLLLAPAWRRIRALRGHRAG